MTKDNTMYSSRSLLTIAGVLPAASALAISSAAHAMLDDADFTPSVEWRIEFQTTHLGTPAIGPDGEIGIHPNDVIVIDPNGTIRWRVPVSNNPDTQVDFDAQGNLYANSRDGLLSFDPEGNQRWILPGLGSDFESFTNHAGPTVGPDGNIYFVDEHLGDLGPQYGFASVTPSGVLRFSNPGFSNRVSDPADQTVIFHDNLAIVGAGSDIPDTCDCPLGGLMAFDITDGSPVWAAHTPKQRQPVVRPNGTILMNSDTTNFEIFDAQSGDLQGAVFGNWIGSIVPGDAQSNSFAVESSRFLTKIGPDGAKTLLTDEVGAISAARGLSPDGSLLVVGTTDANGANQRAITGIDPQTGAVLWTIPLPVEDNWPLTAVDIPAFTTDGSRIYVSVSGLNKRYLYAVQLKPASCTADINNDGVLDFFDVSDFINAFGSGEPDADFNADGNIDFFDVSDFIQAFSAGCP